MGDQDPSRPRSPNKIYDYGHHSSTPTLRLVYPEEIEESYGSNSIPPYRARSILHQVSSSGQSSSSQQPAYPVINANGQDLSPPHQPRLSSAQYSNEPVGPIGNRGNYTYRNQSMRQVGSPASGLQQNFQVAPTGIGIQHSYSGGRAEQNSALSRHHNPTLYQQPNRQFEPSIRHPNQDVRQIRLPVRQPNPPLRPTLNSGSASRPVHNSHRSSDDPRNSAQPPRRTTPSLQHTSSERRRENSGNDRLHGSQNGHSTDSSNPAGQNSHSTDSSNPAGQNGHSTDSSNPAGQNEENTKEKTPPLEDPRLHKHKSKNSTNGENLSSPPYNLTPNAVTNSSATPTRPPGYTNIHDPRGLGLSRTPTTAPALRSRVENSVELQGTSVNLSTTPASGNQHSSPFVIPTPDAPLPSFEELVACANATTRVMNKENSTSTTDLISQPEAYTSSSDDEDEIIIPTGKTGVLCSAHAVRARKLVKDVERTDFPPIRQVTSNRRIEKQKYKTRSPVTKHSTESAAKPQSPPHSRNMCNKPTDKFILLSPTTQTLQCVPGSSGAIESARTHSQDVKSSASSSNRNNEDRTRKETFENSKSVTSGSTQNMSSPPKRKHTEPDDDASLVRNGKKHCSERSHSSKERSSSTSKAAERQVVEKGKLQPPQYVPNENQTNHNSSTANGVNDTGKSEPKSNSKSSHTDISKGTHPQSSETLTSAVNIPTKPIPVHPSATEPQLSCQGTSSSSVKEKQKLAPTSKPSEPAVTKQNEKQKISEAVSKQGSQTVDKPAPKSLKKTSNGTTSKDTLSSTSSRIVVEIASREPSTSFAHNQKEVESLSDAETSAAEKEGSVPSVTKKQNRVEESKSSKQLKGSISNKPLHGSESASKGDKTAGKSVLLETSQSKEKEGSSKSKETLSAGRRVEKPVQPPPPVKSVESSATTQAGKETGSLSLKVRTSGQDKCSSSNGTEKRKLNEKSNSDDSKRRALEGKQNENSKTHTISSDADKIEGKSGQDLVPKSSERQASSNFQTSFPSSSGQPPVLAPPSKSIPQIADRPPRSITSAAEPPTRLIPPVAQPPSRPIPPVAQPPSRPIPPVAQPPSRPIPPVADAPAKSHPPRVTDPLIKSIPSPVADNSAKSIPQPVADPPQAKTIPPSVVDPSAKSNPPVANTLTQSISPPVIDPLTSLILPMASPVVKESRRLRIEAQTSGTAESSVVNAPERRKLDENSKQIDPSKHRASGTSLNGQEKAPAPTESERRSAGPTAAPKSSSKETLSLSSGKKAPVVIPQTPTEPVVPKPCAAETSKHSGISRQEERSASLALTAATPVLQLDYQVCGASSNKSSDVEQLTVGDSLYVVQTLVNQNCEQLTVNISRDDLSRGSMTSGLLPSTSTETQASSRDARLIENDSTNTSSDHLRLTNSLQERSRRLIEEIPTSPATTSVTSALCGDAAELRVARAVDKERTPLSSSKKKETPGAVETSTTSIQITNPAAFYGHLASNEASLLMNSVNLLQAPILPSGSSTTPVNRPQTAPAISAEESLSTRSDCAASSAVGTVQDQEVSVAEVSDNNIPGFDPPAGEASQPGNASIETSVDVDLPGLDVVPVNIEPSNTSTLYTSTTVNLVEPGSTTAPNIRSGEFTSYRTFAAENSVEVVITPAASHSVTVQSSSEDFPVISITENRYVDISDDEAEDVSTISIRRDIFSPDPEQESQTLTREEAEKRKEIEQKKADEELQKRKEKEKKEAIQKISSTFQAVSAAVSQELKTISETGCSETTELEANLVEASKCSKQLEIAMDNARVELATISGINNEVSAPQRNPVSRAMFDSYFPLIIQVNELLMRQFNQNSNNLLHSLRMVQYRLYRLLKYYGANESVMMNYLTKSAAAAGVATTDNFHVKCSQAWDGIRTFSGELRSIPIISDHETVGPEKFRKQVEGLKKAMEKNPSTQSTSNAPSNAVGPPATSSAGQVPMIATSSNNTMSPPRSMPHSSMQDSSSASHGMVHNNSTTTANERTFSWHLPVNGPASGYEPISSQPVLVYSNPQHGSSMRPTGYFIPGSSNIAGSVRLPDLNPEVNLQPPASSRRLTAGSATPRAEGSSTRGGKGRGRGGSVRGRGQSHAPTARVINEAKQPHSSVATSPHVLGGSYYTLTVNPASVPRHMQTSESCGASGSAAIDYSRGTVSNPYTSTSLGQVSTMNTAPLSHSRPRQSDFSVSNVVSSDEHLNAHGGHILRNMNSFSQPVHSAYTASNQAQNFHYNSNAVINRMVSPASTAQSGNSNPTVYRMSPHHNEQLHANVANTYLEANYAAYRGNFDPAHQAFLGQSGSITRISPPHFGMNNSMPIHQHQTSHLQAAQTFFGNQGPGSTSSGSVLVAQQQQALRNPSSRQALNSNNNQNRPHVPTQAELNKLIQLHNTTDVLLRNNSSNRSGNNDA